MINRLFICEKPATARALADILGIEDKIAGKAPYFKCRKGDYVAHARGHLLEPKDPDEIRPEWEKWASPAVEIAPEIIPLKVVASTRSLLDQIGELIRHARAVVIATDIDREGSMIGQEIIEHFHYGGPLWRLPLNKLQPEDIRQALDRMERERDKLLLLNYAQASEARLRAYIDWIEGMTFSRALTVHIAPAGVHKQTFHFGGVQTRLLGLVYAREMEIRGFVAKTHYQIAVSVETAPWEAYPSAVLTLGYRPGGRIGGTDDRRIYDAGLAEALREAVSAWSGPLAVSRTPGTVRPPAPFNLSSLQKAAGKACGFSPALTLQILQGLYERGFVSYPRSDHIYYPHTAIEAVPRIMAAIAGLDSLKHLVPARPVIQQGKGRPYDAPGMPESAHEAIMPLAATPASVARLDGDDRAIYELVARNYLANHYESYGFDKTEISLTLPDGFPGRDPVTFLATESITTRPGWKSVYEGVKDAGLDGPGEGAEGEESGSRLPPLPDGLPARAVASSISSSKTTPPKRFVYADLPSEMANLIRHVEDPQLKKALQTDDPEKPKGLGTEATRAAHINDLMDMNDGWVRKIVSQGKEKVQSNPQKSYLTLLPNTRQVAVAPKGMYLMASIRALRPALADPVERAKLEHLISGLGQLKSREEIDRQSEVIKAAMRTRISAFLPEFHAFTPLDPASVTGAEGFGVRTVSARQREIMLDLKRRKGIALPDGALVDAGIARKFLDEHIGPASGHRPATGRGGAENSGGNTGKPASDRPASAAQIKFVQSIAARRNIPAPDYATMTSRQAADFIDQHGGQQGEQRGGRGRSRPASGSRGAAGRPGRARGGGR